VSKISDFEEIINKYYLNVRQTSLK